MDGESEDIWMTSIYDRYKARPDNKEFETTVYTHI